MPARNPDLFHGYQRPDGFFEGWYFRIVTGGRSICLIPGVAVGADPHAFVQVADSHTKVSRILRYPLTAFSAGSYTPSVRVGDSLFSLSHLHLDLMDIAFSLTGDLHFSAVRTYPDWWLGRGSMGAVGRLPFLACYTQICALDGRVDGRITLSGEVIDIQNGRLYVEKNWGHSFPAAYCWIQGFLGPDAGFTCSIGQVPVGPLSMDGMVACLYQGDKIYHFHTFRGGRFDLETGPDGAALSAICGRYALKVRVSGGHPLRLPAPIRGEMTGEALESLDATATLLLFDLDTGACLLRQKAEGIGLEIGGHWLGADSYPPISPV